MSSGGIFFESHALAFRLKVMPKINHLGALFQELCVESSRCFDAVSQLLLITQHLHVCVDAISHLCFVAQKMPTFILSQSVKLESSWSRISVISDGFSAVEINFLIIRCSNCGQAIVLQLRLVLGGRIKSQAQQAQFDLIRLCCSVSREWSLSCSKWFSSLMQLANAILARFRQKSAVFFLC